MKDWIYDQIEGGSKQQFPISIGVKWSDPPEKDILHTTETTGWPGYVGGATAPHATINPRTRETRQHIPCSWGARALRPGGVRANNDGAAQFEIIGFAKDTQDWPDEWYEYIAHVIGVFNKNMGIKNQSSVTFKGSNDAYGTNSSTRMSAKQYDDYRGIMGHQHVPGNSHWDPGRFDIKKLLGLLNGEITVDPEKPNKYPKLEVDGYLGKATIRRGQQDEGTPVDGVVSSQPERWKQKNPGLTSGWQWVANNRAKGSLFITAQQKRFAKMAEGKGRYTDDIDGMAGENHWTSFQEWLKATVDSSLVVDGEIWEESPAVKAYQRYLNKKAGY